MARILRKTQKIYASSAGATGITEYGSPASGTPAYSTDLDDIQTSAWETGWSAAALAGSEIPTFQDFNAIHYVFANQIGYLLQEGIPEYDAGTEYHQFSIVRKTGTYELYGSKTNTNTGNALPSQTDNTDWQYLGTLADLGNTGIPAGTPAYFGGATAPTGYLVCDGAAVSRTTYAALFTAIGTIYGAGDGSTTFNLPDEVTNNRFRRASGGSLSVGQTQTDNVGSFSFSTTISGTFTAWDTGTTPAVGSTGNTMGAQSGSTGNSATLRSYSMSGGSGETRPDAIAYLPCIKF